jgi:CrcB protein
MAMSPAGWAAVGLLGGAAAGARYLFDAELAHRADAHFPFGILTVNLLGAFALGLVAGSALHGEALTIVAGGVIGSFTTFSTWMLDTHLLGATERAHLAWLNVAVSLAIGFAAVSLGHWLAGAL